MKRQAQVLVLTLGTACSATETGNPVRPTVMELRAVSSDDNVVSLDAEATGTVLLNAEIGIAAARFLRCDGRAEPIIGAPTAVDLLPDSSAVHALPVPEGRYCSVELELDAMVLPSAPQRSVWLSGNLEDGRSYEIHITEPHVVALEGEFRVPLGGQLLLALDAAAWLADVSFAQAQEEADGSILIDEESNVSIHEAVRRNLTEGAALYRDWNANSVVDPEDEPPLATTSGYDSSGQVGGGGTAGAGGTAGGSGHSGAETAGAAGNGIDAGAAGTGNGAHAGAGGATPPRTPEFPALLVAQDDGVRIWYGEPSITLPRPADVQLGGVSGRALALAQGPDSLVVATDDSRNALLRYQASLGLLSTSSPVGVVETEVTGGTPLAAVHALSTSQVDLWLAEQSGGVRLLRDFFSEAGPTSSPKLSLQSGGILADVVGRQERLYGAQPEDGVFVWNGVSSLTGDTNPPAFSLYPEGASPGGVTQVEMDSDGGLYAATPTSVLVWRSVDDARGPKQPDVTLPMPLEPIHLSVSDDTLVVVVGSAQESGEVRIFRSARELADGAPPDQELRSDDLVQPVKATLGTDGRLRVLTQDQLLIFVNTTTSLELQVALDVPNANDFLIIGSDT